MEKGSIPLTTFNAPQGMYKWLVMLIGLKNTSSMLQHKMDDAFKYLKNFYVIYIDYVLVFSNYEKEHYVVSSKRKV